MTIKSKILLAILFLLATGVVTTKIVIKNPALSSSPCLNVAIENAPKFPLSLFESVKIEEVSRTQVKIKFYSIFAIKLPYEQQLFCTLTN